MPNEVRRPIDNGRPRHSISVITINRPEARNAIDQAVTVGVAAALDELDERDDLTLGIITGAGGTFCAGMDLKAFLAGESVSLPGRGLLGMCTRPPRKPVIAAVEGWALAGGFEVALACDLIVAAENAKFGIPEVKRGLIAAAGGCSDSPAGSRRQSPWRWHSRPIPSQPSRPTAADW